jgi:hypothetical protein
MEIRSIPILLLLPLLLLQCDGGEPVPPALVEGRTVKAPSRLYFQNIRSIRYTEETDTRSRARRYLLKTWQQAAPAEPFRCWLVDDWLHDQAYLQWRRTDAGEGLDTLPVLFRIDGLVLDLPAETQEGAVVDQFSRQLVQAIEQGKAIEWQRGKGTYRPLDPDTRRWLVTIWRDYERLTE